MNGDSEWIMARNDELNAMTDSQLVAEYMEAALKLAEEGE